MSIGQMQAIFTRLEELERQVAELKKQQVLYPQREQLPPYLPERRGPGRPKGTRNGL